MYRCPLDHAQARQEPSELRQALHCSECTARGRADVIIEKAI